MDRLCGLDARRVKHTLSSNLDKERQTWQPVFIKPSCTCPQGINQQQRDESAAWVALLASEFKFLPETCGLAVHLMDRVLQLVKVRAKYLHCVAVTCLYIAAKTLEEDENIPPTPDLVRKSGCGYSFAEITRMEMVILSKLEWNIRQPSAVDFLHNIHAVLLLHYPHILANQSDMSPSEHLTLVMRKMIRCLTCHDLMQFRPSTLALALISLELEQITPGWLRLVLALQRIIANVGSEQLMLCREMIADFLGHHLHVPNSFRSRTSSSSAPLSKKRKVEHLPSAEDDREENMYDGIKRLYSEEGFACKGGCVGAEKQVLRSSCSLEMHQDTDETNATIRLGYPLIVS